ncbi:MAG TPA: PKD domain-containing protein, partial [Thermoanaerobaculia bacterium]
IIGNDTKSVNITVAPPPPVAEFSFSPAAPGPGETVQFTDASNGNPSSWSWTFGDPSSGTENKSTLQNPTHVFAAAGQYTVTLSAKNAGGTGLRNHAVTVAVAAPATNFTFTPQTPRVGGTVQFTDTSTGNPTAWSWNFGDPGSGPANTSVLQNPTHSFSAAGTYNVSLKATGAGGSNTRTQTISVTRKCVRCPRVVNFRSVNQ